MRFSSFAVPLLFSAFLFVGCVDTTGLSAVSAAIPSGNPHGLVTVTEYGDLQCPACGTAYSLLNKPLVDKYGKEVKFVFKHFPLSSLHAYAFEAAEAAECAADQGKFWEFIDMNYTHQADLSSESLRKWAKDLGLDTALFERCLSSNIKRKIVQADYDAGLAVGVNATPTFFVDDVKITSNDLETMSRAIDAALQQKNNVPL